MQLHKVVLFTLAIAAASSRAQPIPSRMGRPFENAPVEDLAGHPTLGLSAFEATMSMFAPGSRGFQMTLHEALQRPCLEPNTHPARRFGRAINTMTRLISRLRITIDTSQATAPLRHAQELLPNVSQLSRRSHPSQFSDFSTCAIPYCGLNLFSTGSGIGVPFYAKKGATHVESVKTMRNVLAGDKLLGKAKAKAKEHAQEHEEEEGDKDGEKH
ncbi:hypothetical protein IE81DRAFT_204123 [Ceraceosorus guamensis]|uniref:Uncharacterized protein n=1 Tax=Ceraceosorus guamensis TaxID=1522189 RepID=A0A316VUZ4_9BASI|nr:hypothetical protein IE81DRAFT_204123 [Ceraceosorus guamensis]PWN40728.1 hypothetical protein IE81DRAFT_204123 [Ceraceosorus guamensis]